MRTNKPLDMLLAEAAVREAPQDCFRFQAGAGSVDVVAAAAGANGQPSGLPTVRMRVYTGGIIHVGIMFATGRYYWGPVVVDLAGMKLPGGPSPVLRNHDIERVVGHGQASIAASVLSLEGVVSGSGPDAQEFLSTSRNKFPWQSSMGVRVLRAEDIDDGAEVSVNGQTFTGPLLVARESEFKEASVVIWGADSDTTARVAAQKEKAMDPKFKAWLIAKGENPEALSAAQLASRKATWEAEVQAAAAPPPPPPPPPPAVPAAPSDADLQAARTEGARLERERVAAIRAEAQGTGIAADVVEASVTGGETVEQARARFLQAMRQRSPSAGAPAIGSSENLTARTIEAGMCLAFQRNVGMDEPALLRAYGEQTLNAADGLRRLRLTEFMELCARAEGVRLPMGRGSNAWIRAAFSTLSLPGILGNVANKALLAAYQSVPSTARRLAKIGRVSDFKTHTRYRLSGNMTFEKVAADGELKHGALGEASFTQKAETFGIFFQLTRQDVINDDLGAFMEIPTIIGRGGAVSLEEAFWTLVLANTASFFGVGHANIYANAAAGLGDAALGVMVQLMRDQQDAHGKPILVEPKFLVVPTALAALAERIFKGQNVIVTKPVTADATGAVASDANIYQGRYEPVVVPHLSNTSFHANASSVDWYLFADPNVLAAFEIAFLNGVETPTVENVPVASDVLGLGFRGYHDFGVAAMDPRGAAKADVG